MNLENSPLHDLDFDHVERRCHERIRQMLMPFASMWDGSLGEISTTTHHIGLTEGAANIVAGIPRWSRSPRG